MHLLLTTFTRLLLTICLSKNNEKNAFVIDNIHKIIINNLFVEK